MSMKRLLLATSLVALTASGAAFAQNSGANSNPNVKGNASVTQPRSPSNSMTGAGDAADQSAGSSGMGSSKSSSGMSSSAAMRGNDRASQADVQRAQQALKDQGLYRGQVDGKMGPQTRNAIAQYQRQNGLKQSAQLDSQTLSDIERGGSSGAGSQGRMPSNSPGASGSFGNSDANGSGASNSGSTSQPTR